MFFRVRIKIAAMKNKMIEAIENNVIVSSVIATPIRPRTCPAIGIPCFFDLTKPTICNTKAITIKIITAKSAKPSMRYSVSVVILELAMFP